MRILIHGRTSSVTPTGVTARALLLLSLIGLSSCSPGNSPDATPWAGHIDTLANEAIHMANPPEGLWAPDEAWTMEEDLRIGEVDAESPATFGRISLLEVDAHGRIWVFDDHAQEIRVFDQEGQFVRKVGGRGKGPGEFQGAIGMSWSLGGNLWVLDPGNMRFAVFDTSGQYQKSDRVEGGSVIIPWPGGFDRKGRLLHYARRPRADGEGFELVMVQFDTTLTPGDTLVIPKYQSPEIFEWRSGQSYMSVRVPFSPRPVWRLSPEGEIWFTDAEDYSVTRIGPSGDTLGIVSKESVRGRVTKEDMDTALGDLAWFTKRGGRIDLSKVPELKPALRDFLFDDEGRIWVLPFRGGQPSPPAFDVFDQAGRFLGSIAVPFPFETNPIPIIRDGSFYAATVDALDVPSVVRARVRESLGGAER